MGASLQVNIDQVGTPNESSRSALVHVEVIVTTTGGTYNNYGNDSSGRGATLYLMIDGSSIERAVTFGSPESGTFNTTLYSNNIIVYYGSSGTRSVSVSAVLHVNTGSISTVSNGDTLTLTPISEGGSSGDEWNDVGGSSNLGGDFFLTPGNATALGMSSYDSYIGSFEDYTAYTTFGYIYNQTYFVAIHCPAIIRFKTPKFTGLSTSVHVAIQLGGQFDIGSFKIALCSSDSNKRSYIDALSVVSDANQMGVSSMTTGITNNTGSIYDAVIPCHELKGETVYYLFIWIPTDSPASDKKTVPIALYDNNSININYITSGDFSIDDGSHHARYTCYIDNGSNHYKYGAYVDDGNSWVLLS